MQLLLRWNLLLKSAPYRIELMKRSSVGVYPRCSLRGMAHAGALCAGQLGVRRGQPECQKWKVHSSKVSEEPRTETW